MFVPVLEALQIGRRGAGRPRTRPNRLRVKHPLSVNLREDMIIG